MSLHLECVNLTKRYRNKLALSPQTLTLTPGETLCVMGESGCGKSTLLRLIGLIDEPTMGHLWFDGVNTTELTFRQKAGFRNEKIGFLFQFFHLIGDWNVIENVSLPLLYGGKTLTEARHQSQRWIDALGIRDLSEQKVKHCSGGQQQRVALARALVTNPSLLLLDEPTASLDNAHGLKLLNCVTEAQQEHGFSMILVSHDERCQSFCQRTMKLYAKDSLPT